MLRKGLFSDFDSLYSIYMDDRINRFLSFEQMSKDQFHPIFKELTNQGQLYVFEVESHLVATCIINRGVRRCRHVASIGTLATKADLQGKGIGTKFMKELIQLLKMEHIKRIDLCVEADNPNAFNFYQKLGFKHEGTLQKYFKREQENQFIDEHLMALLLE